RSIGSRLESIIEAEIAHRTQWYGVRREGSISSASHTMPGTTSCYGVIPAVARRIFWIIPLGSDRTSCRADRQPRWPRRRNALENMILAEGVELYSNILSCARRNTEPTEVQGAYCA